MTKGKLDRKDAFSSILGAATAKSGGAERQIPLDEIYLNPNQPRKFFDEAALEQLTRNVRDKGVLQPILLRERESGYELVAGERRYRAAQRAGLGAIPAVVRDLSDEETLEIALTENLSREDLNPVEETDSTLKLLSLKLGVPVQEVVDTIRASHYKALGRTVNTGVNKASIEVVEELFRKLGRFTTSSFYTHRLPILRLPENLLSAVRGGKIEYSKARLLAGVQDEAQGQALLQRIVDEKLSRSQIKVELKKLLDTSEQPAGATRVDVSKVKRKLTPRRIEALSETERHELGVLLQKLDALLGND